ncbi:MAG: hypothetical protein ABI765_05660, partial [Gemmatimonadota bacterium]
MPLNSRLTAVIALTLLAFPLPAAAQVAGVSGTVFLDRNANGVKDAGEPGIAGVVVSDQAAAVRTDASGAFHLAGGGGYGLVSISLP